MSAYQKSGTVLASLQGVANRFPNLKSNEQYHRLVDSIQACETDVQGRRQSYNASVKDYNSVCLSIPTIFVARAIGFGKAPYLEFDLSGVNDVTTLMEFKTDDGERLQQLLNSAGGNIAGATRVIASHAAQTGKLIVDKAKEKSLRSYFYMIPGGVPQGPASPNALQVQLSNGTLDSSALVAEAGTSDWKPILSLFQDAETASL